MIYPAQLAYASSLGEESKNIGLNYSMLALAYIIGVPLGYILGKISWKYLFLLPSLIVFTSIFSIPRLLDLKGNFGNPKSVVGPLLFFNGILISPYLLYVGIPVSLLGIYLLSKWELEKKFLKPLIAGFMHSLSRSAIVEFLVLSYVGRTPLLAILFPLPMAILSAPLGIIIGNRSRIFAIAGFSLMLLSWLLLINKLLATLILGIGTGIASVSNTAYTLQNLRIKDRIVGSAIKALEGVVGISVGPAISIVVYHIEFGVELTILLLNLTAILLIL